MSEQDPTEGMSLEEVLVRAHEAISGLEDPTDPALLAGALHRANLVNEEQAARLFRAPRAGEILTAQQVQDFYDAAPVGVFSGHPDSETGEVTHARAVVLVPTPFGDFFLHSYGCCRPVEASAPIKPEMLARLAETLYEMTHSWRSIDLNDEDTWPGVDEQVLMHLAGHTTIAYGTKVRHMARHGLDPQWRPMPKAPEYTGHEVTLDG